MGLFQRDSENADRDITSKIAVLTDTVDVSGNYVVRVMLGDGAKDLDGTGGAFELSISIDGRVAQPNPQVIAVEAATTEGNIESLPFITLAGEEVIAYVLSPNAADTDVDVTASLQDLTRALPAVAPDGAGGLPISDAGELDLDTQLANTHEITAARMGALTDWIDGGRLDAILDLILEDSNALQSALGSKAYFTMSDNGTADLVSNVDDNYVLIEDVQTVVDSIPGLIAALNDLSTTDLQTAIGTNATDQLAELAQGIPVKEPSLAAAIMLLYMMVRNNFAETETEKSVYNDAGVEIAKKVISDNGTTYNEDEMVSGA